jgi:predicted dienelactone hydrolase
LRPYSPGGMLIALASAPKDLLTSDTKHPSFKARTTGVSNPVRSPSFRASASVSAQLPAFAAGVPLDIYAFHRYTENSSSPFRTLARQYHLAAPG